MQGLSELAMAQVIVTREIRKVLTTDEKPAAKVRGMQLMMVLVACSTAFITSYAVLATV